MFDPKTGYIRTVGFGLYTEGYLTGNDLHRAQELTGQGAQVGLHGPQQRGGMPTLLYRFGNLGGWYTERKVRLSPNPEEA